MPPVVIAAAIAGTAAVGAAVVGAQSQTKAAKLASRGALKAGETAAEGYLQAGEQLQTGLAEAAEEVAPWRNVGEQALYDLSAELGIELPEGAEGTAGGYLQTPFYQQEKQEIAQAMEKSAASRGLLRSGGTMKAIGETAGRYAARSRESYLTRLTGLAGMGYGAAGYQSQLKAEGVAGAATATERAAQARASSYLRSSKARAEGILGRGESIAGGIAGVGKAAGFGLGAFDPNWNVIGGGT